MTVPGLLPIDFDGVTELWVHDIESIAAVSTDPSDLETVRPAIAKLRDPHRCEYVVSQENPVHGWPARPATDTHVPRSNGPSEKRWI